MEKSDIAEQLAGILCLQSDQFEVFIDIVLPNELLIIISQLFPGSNVRESAIDLGFARLETLVLKTDLRAGELMMLKERAIEPEA